MKTNMNKLFRILVALLALTPAIAMADLYLQIPGVPGDIVDKVHGGWIRAAELSRKVDAGTSWLNGGGASVGKPIPGELTIRLPSGPWSK